jgi:hypothetical protein
MTCGWCWTSSKSSRSFLHEDDFEIRFRDHCLRHAGAGGGQAQLFGRLGGELRKSDLGPMAAMAPTSMTRKVDHSDPAMTVTQASVGGPQGDQTVTMKYSTDGKETTNEMMGAPVKSVATWDGETLLIKTKLEIQGMEIGLTDKWALSDGGKTLTDTSHIVSPQGEFDVVYVLVKK